MMHFLGQEMEKLGETWRLSSTANEKRPSAPSRVYSHGTGRRFPSGPISKALGARCTSS